MNTHIDTLAGWWENAEIGPAHAGDTVIRHDNTDDSYEVYTLGADTMGTFSYLRVLERAPKPEPAWHDAPAVIAEVHAFNLPRVFVKDYEGIWNDALTGRGYSPDVLSHVTPLIEAKVTDEMVIRARGSLKRETGYDYAHATVQDAVTAALGLETA